MPLDISNFAKDQDDLGTQLAGGSGVSVQPTGATPNVAALAATEVFAPTATGISATDIANLAAAITATPAGGTLYLDGHYKHTGLTFPTPIRVKGRQKVTYTGLGALPSGPNSLSEIQGTILECTAAATDCIAVTIAGGTFHLEDVVPAFSTGLASTGHGINCAPPTNVVGVYGGSIDDVMVYGHDGNHYALVLNNELEVTTRDFRWSGGGGILTIAQAASGFNFGNNVHIHPYGVLSAAGTAHGFAHSSAANTGNSGILNLLTYIRPQCNITGGAGAGGTQKLWTDTAGASNPIYVTVISADLEASGFANGLDYGPSTQFLGDTYVASTSVLNMLNSLNTRLGFQALALAGQNVGTQQKSVAIGQSALASLTTGTAATAVGYFALQAATGAQNTAVGYTAGQGVVAAAACTFIGNAAGFKGGGTAGNATVASNYGTAVGFQSGPGSANDPQAYVAIGKNALVGSGTLTAIGHYAVAIGAGTTAQFSGSVAIGVDHNGLAATAGAQDTFALGAPNHQVKISNNTTGAGSAALGANCPAVTATAPYTWFKMMSSDLSTVYVPAWK